MAASACLLIMAANAEVELVCATDPDGLDSNTEYATGILDLFDVRSGEWVGSISEEGHAHVDGSTSRMSSRLFSRA